MTENLYINVDGERLKKDIETIATFVDKSKPGWTRRSFSQWDHEAREWLIQQMKDSGLNVRTDAASNIIGEVPGSNLGLPPIVIGSHTDTVEGGGRFDGIIGVLAGLEVARRIKEAGITLKHTLEVVNFTSEELNEELMVNHIGSRGMVNNFTSEMLDSKNAEGKTLKTLLNELDGNADLIADNARKKGDIALYLELHIEQGPVLEHNNKKLGVITGLVAAHRYYVTVEGQQNHVGGSPMHMRRDALAGANQMMVDFETLFQGEEDESSLIGTVGKLDIEPNVFTIIPGKVTFSIDVRSLDTDLLEKTTEIFKKRAKEIADSRGLTVTFEEVTKSDAILVNNEIQDVIENACTSVGSAMRMQCGASHDGSQIGKIAPIGMIFVPSKDGRSHCPEEWTNYEDVVLGTEALGRSVLLLDNKMN